MQVMPLSSATRYLLDRGIVNGGGAGRAKGDWRPAMKAGGGGLNGGLPQSVALCGSASRALYQWRTSSGGCSWARAPGR